MNQFTQTKPAAFVLRQVSLLLALALLFQLQANSAVAACPQVQCLYFPHLARSEPVRINSVNFGNPGRSQLFTIIGDIINTSTVPVYGVTLRATILDPSRKISETVTRTTELSATFPGQLNSFGLSIGYPVGQLGSTFTELAIVSWTTTSTQQLRNATIVSTQVYSTPGPSFYIYTIVAGTLRNDTGFTLRNIEVRVWSTALLELGSSRPIDSLAPDQSSSFSVLLGNYSPTRLNTFKVVAQGIVSP